MGSMSPKEEEVLYDRISEVKAFDETKLGVKGLVDVGITKVPRMFHTEPTFEEAPPGSPLVPTIDLHGIDDDPILRRGAVERILDASTKYGFFQVVNHGIPASVLEEMIGGVRRFFEQDSEKKKEWYTRDFNETVIYNSNYDLYTADSANWRDTAYVVMAPNPPHQDKLPPVCRSLSLSNCRN